MSAPAGTGVALTLADLCDALAQPVIGSATFLNEIAARHPEAIPLAAGRPYDGFFDPAELPDLLDRYLRYLREEQGLDEVGVTRQLFQYGRTAGHIRELVTRTLANDTGLRVDPEAVVVLTGAQEGMLVCARALCPGPDDVLLVPSPCYIGMLGAAGLLGVPVVGVPEGPDGLAPADVAEVARRVRAEGRRPRALYVVPNFANPSGHTLSHADRLALLAVAEAEDLILIEDDPYGFLAEPAYREPALKALDTGGRVVHIGTFAKTCFPGARVGYVVADQPVRLPDGRTTLLAEQLSLLRSMITVNTSALAQAVIGGMLLRADCRLDAANADRAAFYRRNLTVLLDSLAREFPPGERDRYRVRWNTPAGGFFVVVTVGFDVDDEVLAESASRYQVLWTPMSYFHLDGGGRRQLRLSCSALTPEQIEEGVRRLARLVRDRSAAIAADPRS
ncbi:aminotransferase-like domain-containing protein [Micromonospora echinofusca]|uniref:Aminotransferase class I/II-fold pyridoxal phosphate-dependent enzyme n=1 Tax=Micromonospora echinofusca TaxID=47858 RepID=A0ABS3VTD5_MICEH|nr:PLP-dependent aminotransferase family protein [Micromonospora echinofusca]MBO4207817.1 aminotransferase class I/II-fold pyridoxal phosphate-dependent enzyme [Micromonospora echinofusca]